MSDSNGPNKAQFEDTLAEYTEIRFQQMRWASKASACLNRFEARGGDRDQVRYGFEQGKRSPEERVAVARARNQVDGWIGVVDWKEDGQGTFAAAFDAKAPVPEGTGAGGAELGSRLSIARAGIDGFNTGRAGGSLADNPWVEILGASQEAAVWAENFGDGLAERPEPKPRKKKEAAEPEGEDGETEEAAPRKRGRRKSSGEHHLDRIRELDAEAAAKKPRRGQKALPAPESEDTKPGWQGDRDFHQEAAEEGGPEDSPAILH